MDNVVFDVVRCLSSFDSGNGDELYEAVANALVRRVDFVTGAVDMKGLPEPDRGEVRRPASEARTQWRSCSCPGRCC